MNANQLPTQYAKSAAKFPIGTRVIADDFNFESGGSYSGPAVVIGYQINAFGQLLFITDQGVFYLFELKLA